MKVYPSKKTLETLKEIADVVSSCAKRPLLVLRSGYDHPFYYNEGIDYQVITPEGEWLLVVTRNFYEFWLQEEVRGSFFYEKGTWTSSRRSRESKRSIDNIGLS